MMRFCVAGTFASFPRLLLFLLILVHITKSADGFSPQVVLPHASRCRSSSYSSSLIQQYNDHYHHPYIVTRRDDRHCLRGKTTNNDDDDDNDDWEYYKQETTSTSTNRKSSAFFGKDTNNSNNNNSEGLFHRVWHRFRSRWSTLLVRLWKRKILFQQWITNKSFQFRKRLRYLRERYTIYVLELENGKYYVGSTTHRKRRFEQHMSKDGGSVWTKRYKPIKLLKEYRRVSSQYYLGLESQITAEYMLKYGVNNVRGAMFAQPKVYTQQDNMEALVGFLGHYNELKYDKVRDILEATLPAGKKPFSSPPPPPLLSSSSSISTTDRTRRFKVRPGRQNKNNRFENGSSGGSNSDRKCYSCGKYGHYAADCPEAKITRRQCRNCGKYGHYAAECPSKDDINNDNDNDDKIDSASFTPMNYRRCLNCGEYGHFAADCPGSTTTTKGEDQDTSSSSANTPTTTTTTAPYKMTTNRQRWYGGNTDTSASSSIKCFNCGKFGHFAANCPDDKKEGITCFACGKKGHMADNCPELSSE